MYVKISITIFKNRNGNKKFSLCNVHTHVRDNDRGARMISSENHNKYGRLYV